MIKPGGSSHLLVGAAVLGILCSFAPAQEVRRAEPVEPEGIPVRRAIRVEPPTPPAVPFDLDPGPDRKPVKAVPSPTPAPALTPPPPAPAAPAGSSLAESPAAAYPARTREEQQIAFADGLYARKVFDMAAAEYQRYLDEQLDGPSRQSALFRLGECFRQLGDLERAAGAYDRLLGSFGRGDFVGPAAYRLAEIHYGKKEYAEALPLFRRASIRLKEPRAVLSAKFYTGRCLESLNLPAQARASYQDVIATREENPFLEVSRLSLARLYANSDRKEEAARQYEELAKESGDGKIRAEALVRSGLLLLELDKDKAAAERLKQALELPEIGSWEELARIGLIHTLYAARQYRQVVESSDEAMKIASPDRKPELLLLTANAHRQMGGHVKAAEIYSQILKDYPGSEFAEEAEYDRLVSLYSSDSPEVLAEVDGYLEKQKPGEKRDQVQLLKAEALYKKGDYGAAAPVYLAIQKSKLPSQLLSDALFKLAWCYAQTGQNALAVDTLTRFLQDYPRHNLAATALAQRAVARQALKDYDGALADFNKVIQDHPKARERELALQQKALVLGQREQNHEMAKVFAQLLREFPESPAAAQANYWIGWAGFEAKDYAAAIPALEKARDLDPGQFFERAALRIMLSRYYLEQRDALAGEVNRYAKEGSGSVPAEVLRWLGAQYFNAKDPTHAAIYWGTLTAQADQAAPDDWLNLARARFQAGEYEAAAEAADRYLGSVTQPAAKAAGLLVLGRAQLALARLAEADKSAGETCRLQPEGKLNAEGRILLGDLEVARGNHSEAAKIYTSVSVVFDDPEITPRAMEKACDALNKAGQTDEAAKMLNKLRSRYPEYGRISGDR